MNNKLVDLNNYLFEALERINDDELQGEALDAEIKRTETICKISDQIIQNGELVFKTMKHMDEYGYNVDKRTVPQLLQGGTNGDK